MNRIVLSLITLNECEHQLFWIDYSGAKISSENFSKLETSFIDHVNQIMVIDFGDYWVDFFKEKKIGEAVYFKASVTDNTANAFKDLLKMLPEFKNREIKVRSCRIAIETNHFSYNKLVQNLDTLKNASDFEKLLKINFNMDHAKNIQINHYDFSNLSEKKLLELNSENNWALSLEELNAIKNFSQSEIFKKTRREEGLPESLTDIEVEILAQTWSEHCKHKIFGAEIDYYEDGKFIKKVNSLFKEYIKNPTYELNKDYTVSVFDDNAGIVRFNSQLDLCIKVETHNSPSALDPYGGALTGILGVNRDIIGTGIGAKPIANTNVFCVGKQNEQDLPKNLLSPKTILNGIHEGVKDGGNKSGIPTVNGSIFFHESYSGKPLVYCGTIGVMPAEINGHASSLKRHNAGDCIVMIGGAVGLDGIHGATVSSLAMDEKTEHSIVQIGDPITQKRMTDFILVARKYDLYNSLTDNGAGGLSSSVGEMAQKTNGACIDLSLVPLKYIGLQPWEIVVSESQERMTISVPKGKLSQFLKLANDYQVLATHIGEFTEDGHFTCKWKNETVAKLSLEFLHKGTPKLKLKADYSKDQKANLYPIWRKQNKEEKDLSNLEILDALLMHPNIASKEYWIKQYDHEVLGGTVVKPLGGLNTKYPNNSAVMWYGAYSEKPSENYEGFAVGCGLSSQFSLDDTKLMAQLAVDEAVRNLICQGVDPEKICLVDNFCWPDPLKSEKNPDYEHKLAQLVRACEGLKEIVMNYQMPLVSGKDSMKNDFKNKEIAISVLPTLLVTALGHHPDIRKKISSQAIADKLILKIGKKYKTDKYFGHHLYDFDFQIKNLNNRLNSFEINYQENLAIYKKLFNLIHDEKINSIHDISDGGMLTCLVEKLFENKLGFKFEDSNISVCELFSEIPGNFLISIDENNFNTIAQVFSSEFIEIIGKTNQSGILELNNETRSIEQLHSIWSQQWPN